MASPDNSNPDRLEVLFDAALQISSPAERAAFLERECAGDSPLRQRLEALLRAAAKAGDFLGDKPAASSTIRLTVPITEKPGDKIGRYKLREKIGEGGCGVVYVAEQEEPVRRRVALKVIKLGMDTGSVVARFEAERQALAMMDHPNIAKVLDAGATDTGRPYFVMELVRGIKITEYCDQNNLSTRERLNLFTSVCNAVQHAHQKGIIHRDLKPSNILVTLHDGVPVPKVIDFGIAKATEGRLTDATVYTELHQFIGTPAYMSPEQAEMSGLDIDTRADIYSLGVLLYELLTGKPPFSAEELLRAGVDEMVRTIREKEPVRPSTRLSTMLEGERTALAKRHSADALKLIAILRGDIDWIVMKCLEKDRTRRYETANGLAADLQRHLNNEPVIARPPSTLYRLQKMARRNKLAFGAATAVLTALVLGISVSAWQAIRASREATAAREAEALAQKESHRADLKAGEAATASQTALSRLAQLSLKEGWRRVEEGDYLGALQPFVEAWQIEGSNAPNADLHRLRLASLLQQCPKLVNVSVLGTNFSRAEFSPDRTRFVTAQNVGRTQDILQVWDTATGRPLKSLMLQIGEVGSLAWSANGKRFLVGGYGREVVPFSRTNENKVVEVGQITYAPYSFRVWDSDTAQALSPTMAFAQHDRKASLNADGSLLAVRVGARTEMIEAASGKRLWTYSPTNQNGGGSGIVFSHDSSLLFAGNEVLDAKEGHRLPGGSDVTNVQRSLLSPDGKHWLTTGYAEGGLQTWIFYAVAEPHDGTPVSPVAGTGLAAFSPDGRSVATADESGIVWLSATEVWGQVIASPMSLPSEVSALVFSSDSKSLATVSRAVNGKSVVRVWDARTGVPITPMLPQSDEVLATTFSDDGTRIYVVSKDGLLAEWDLRTSGVPRFTWPFWTGTADNPMWTVAISPNGKFLAANPADDVASIWNLENGELVMDHLQFHFQPATLRFTHDNTRLYVNGGERELHVWEVTTGKSIASQCSSEGRFTMKVDGGGPIRNPSFVSQDGLQVLLDNGEIRNAVTWNLIGKLEGGSTVGGLFSPDGKLVLARQHPGGTTLVWNVSSPQPLMRVPPPTPGRLAGKSQIHTSPDGRWQFLIHENANRGIEIWDPKTGERSRVGYAGLTDGSWINDAALSADGDFMLAVIGARAWVESTKNGKQTTPLLQHHGTIAAGGFSSDGKIVATASADKTIRLWDSKSGEQVALFRHSASLLGGQFSPDGQGIAAWDERSVPFWELPKDNRSLDEWKALAELFGDAPVSGGLTSKSFRESWNSLRAARSRDFTVSGTELDAWHRHAASWAKDRGDWSNVVQHITQLIETHPNDGNLFARRADAAWYFKNEATNVVFTNLWRQALSDYEQVLAWIDRHPEISSTSREAVHEVQDSRGEVLRKLGQTNEAQKIWLKIHEVPPRATNADARFIDLSSYYNWAEDSPLASSTIRKFVTGTEFDVRASAWLASKSEIGYPKEIRIPIGRACRQIHILHTAWTDDETGGVSVSKFVLRLANGTTQTLEIKTGDDVWNWEATDGAAKPTKNSQIAWRGPSDSPKQAGSQRQLFQSTWRNPSPDVIVESIDFISAFGEPQPGLYGITLE